MSDRSYYIAENGQSKGPLTIAELGTRAIESSMLVWRDGMTEWSRIDAVPELAGLLKKFGGEVVQPVAPGVEVTAEPASVERPVTPFQDDAAFGHGRPTLQAGMTPPPARPLEYLNNLSAVQPASGMAIASMVLGILSVLSFCGFHVGALIGIPSAVLAIVFGYIAKGKVKTGQAGGAGFAKAGIILGFVYLGIVVAFFLVVISIIIVVALSR